MTEVVAKPVKINLRRDIKKMENELRDARRLMLTIRTKLQEAVIEANRSKTAIHDRLKRIEDFL